MIKKLLEIPLEKRISKHSFRDSKDTVNVIKCQMQKQA